MSKVIMEFSIPEERSEMLCAQRGSEYYSMLWDIEMLLRKYKKYEELDKTQSELIDKLSEEFYAIVGNYSDGIE